MRDDYDFLKGVKNPYADRLKQGYAVTVYYGFSESGNDADEDMDPKNYSDKKQSQSQA